MSDEQNNLENSPLDVASELSKTRLHAFLFCEWADIINGDKPVLAAIFDKMYVTLEQLPIQLNLFMYARIAHTSGNSIDIIVYMPNGNYYAKMQLNAPHGYTPVSGEINIAQVVTRIELVFPTHGIYWFEIRDGRERIGLVPLTVALPTMESQDATGSDETDIRLQIT